MSSMIVSVAVVILVAREMNVSTSPSEEDYN